MEQLKDFKNRLYKSRGMERINEEDFKMLDEKIDDLIQAVESIQEDDE